MLRLLLRKPKNVITENFTQYNSFSYNMCIVIVMTFYGKILV